MSWLLPLLLILWAALPGTTLAARPSGIAQTSEAPQLVATLQRPDATTFEKARACQQLAIVGDASAVPALAALLPDSDLSAFARAALEQIPDPTAGDALRTAIQQLTGLPLIGVIQSLGVRVESASIDTLLSLVTHASPGVAPAALIALSHFDSERASRKLVEMIGSSSAELRTAAAEGALRCAERQLLKQRHNSATELFAAVRSAMVPEPLRLAATRGEILAGGSRRVPGIIELLRSGDPARRNLAAQVARELPGDDVSKALANELRNSPPEVQTKLIQILADRKATRVRHQVEELAGAPNATVQQACLKALGSLGDASSLPILIAAVASDDPIRYTAATESLRRIQHRKTNGAIVEALRNTPPQGRARLIAVLGDRNAITTTKALLQQATDSHSDVAKAAFDALSVVASPRDLDGLIAAAATATDPAIREKAERALSSTCLKITDKSRRCDALASAYVAGGSTEFRSSLLQVMGSLGDATAYKTVATAYGDSTPVLRDTAFQLLVNWPDATPVPLLLETFKTTPDLARRLVALRGVVTLSTLWTDTPERAAAPLSPPPDQSVDWLRQAHAAIRNDAEEKKTVISGLATLNCAEGLRLLQTYLADASVKRDAQLAYLRAARRLGTTADRDLARPVVQRLAKEGTDAAVQREATDVLKLLGGNPG
ncbi:MAG: HEAT repeat domain-containing protein [Verrucomicrobiales bacterium]|nr:HEAT repeat domain-containing protein [Verrucomicrobiales bacterium]